MNASASERALTPPGTFLEVIVELPLGVKGDEVSVVVLPAEVEVGAGGDLEHISHQSQQHAERQSVSDNLVPQRTIRELDNQS